MPVENAQLPEIVDFINRAYRSIGDARSWTAEEGYIDGSRTTASGLRAEIAANPGASLFAWRHRETGETVCLGRLADDSWAMGTLAVEPRVQNAGLGRRLLARAEAWIAARGAREVEITVFNVRDSSAGTRGAAMCRPARRGHGPTTTGLASRAAMT